MSPGAQVLEEVGFEVSSKYEGGQSQSEERVNMNNHKASAPVVSSGFDGALELAGHSGRWQCQLFLVVGLANIIVACHTVAPVFLSATPDHWCDAGWTQNSSEGSTINIRNMTSDSNEFSRCLSYKRNYILTNDSTISLRNSKNYKNKLISDINMIESTLPSKDMNELDHIKDRSKESAGQIDVVVYMNKTESCDSWHFDTSIFKSTIVTEYTLVCDHSWLKSLVPVVYMLGFLVGSLVMGDISDRFGRRKTSLFCTVTMMVLSYGCVFVPAFWGLLVLRFLLAIASSGVCIVNFVLIMEVASPNLRTVYGMLYGFTFGLAMLPLAAIAYFIRNWRYLQLALSFCTTILLGNFKLLPESPRWLSSQGRQSETLQILKDIAKTNGRTLPPNNEIIINYLKPREVPSQEPKGLNSRCKNIFGAQLTLVRTPIMRRRCLVCFFMWFVCAMTYYGITFSGGNINADLFLMTVVGGLMEMIGTSSLLFVLARFGRRKISCSCFVISGISCLLILTVPRDYVYMNFALMNVGKCFISGVFQLCYIYSAELVPTAVRNISVGTSSMCARIGSSMAPIIVDILGGVHWALPSTIFGVFALIAAALTLLLPETQNIPLPESVADVEAQDK